MRHRCLIIIIFVSIIILIAGLMYWNKTVGLKPNIAPFPASTTQTSSTTNWKTYTSAKYGISFKYPNNWTILTDNSDQTIIIQGEAIDIKDGSMVNNTLININISSKILSDKICTLSLGCYPYNQLKQVRVAGVSGYQIDIDMPVDGGTDPNKKVRDIVLQEGNNIYEVSQQRYVSKEDDFLIPFNQILSTLRFTK